MIDWFYAWFYTLGSALTSALPLSLNMALCVVFIVAFVAASVLSLPSEVVLLYWVAQYPNAWGLFFLVAIAGNVLGALSTFAFGWWLSLRQSLTVKDSVRSILSNWGVYALLFSPVPLLGDALVFAAGYLRFPLVLSILFITMGKTLRYSVLIAAWVP
jgi:membrane protein YqaA with SNARE-associated domain